MTKFSVPAPPAKSGATPAQKPGVEVGDHVYVRHPKRGPIAVRVASTGKDGLHGDCDQGARHGIPWADVLGHKARMLHRYTVVDQGADGAILSDPKGKRRYLEGEVPIAGEAGEQPAGYRKPPSDGSGDDPILGGMAKVEMRKAMLPDNAVVVFAKAGAIANRPGLTLKDETDKLGHQTKRWVRTMKPEPKGREPGKGEPMKHGDVVGFKHENVHGEGKIVASGADGVTLQAADGQEHRVRHEHLTGPAKPEGGEEAHQENTEVAKPGPAYPERGDGGDDKKYFKRVAGDLPDPDELPEDHSKYFNMEGATTVPIDKLVSTKTDEENAKGGGNSPKFMRAAYDGKVAKRDPITVEKMPDGRYKVTDGNGTLTGAKRKGWKSLPVKIEGGDAGAGGDKGAASLFTEEETASLPAKAVQPTKDKAELYAKSGEALESLKEWLNKGKGVASKLGYQTMNKPPEDVDFTAEKGGMLFIAPLKSEKRAGEKVEQDYGGDWSQLRDVVRCSLAVDTMDDLHQCLAALKSNGLKLAMKPKDRFTKPLPEGYRDLLMNVQFENGTIGEVQLHIKPMLAAKNEGHKHYETMRDIDAKPRDQWSDEDSQSWQKAFDASSAIYGKAWQAASGGGEMRKAMGMGEWEFFDRDGAQFRRPAGKPGGATDVLRGKAWAPYEGDRTAAYLQGDAIEDPLGGGSAGGGGGGDDVAKGLALETVHVAGHVTAGGVVVKPYQALRLRRVEEPKKPAAAPESWHARAVGKMKGLGEGWRRFVEADAAAATKRAGEVYGDMRKSEAPAILFYKAQIPGAGTGDMFGDTVAVAGHMKAGRYVAPYHAARHKKAEAPAITTLAPHTPQPKNAVSPAFQEMKDALDARRAHAAKLAAPGKPVRLTHPDGKGRSALAGPDVAGPGKFRVTWLDDKGPIGHQGENTLHDAVFSALQAGFQHAPKPAEPVDGPGPDSTAKHFYVSAIDGKKKHLVAGPYPTHGHAKAQVEAVRAHADRDPRAHFMAWGTTGTEAPIKTPLGENWQPEGMIAKALRVILRRPAPPGLQG